MQLPIALLALLRVTSAEAHLHIRPRPRRRIRRASPVRRRRTEAVCVERLCGALPTALDGERYRDDYRCVLGIVAGGSVAGTGVVAVAPHG
jgi:hypothetical protein